MNSKDFSRSVTGGVFKKGIMKNPHEVFLQLDLTNPVDAGIFLRSIRINDNFVGGIQEPGKPGIQFNDLTPAQTVYFAQKFRQENFPKFHLVSTKIKLEQN